jgi:hypothetical protein
LGRAFFLSVLIFFPAVTGCQHNLHQPEIRTKKLSNHNNNKKIKKTKTNLKPDSHSSEAHSYLLAGNRACSQGQKRAHSGATGTLHTRRHAHGALHSRSPAPPHCSTQCEEVTTRRDTTHSIHLHFLPLSDIF